LRSKKASLQLQPAVLLLGAGVEDPIVKVDVVGGRSEEHNRDLMWDDLYGDEGLDDTVKGGMKSEAREASNVRSSSMYYTSPR
jgi:hypothetical protein